MLITMSGTEQPKVFTDKVNAKFSLSKALKQRGHLTFPPQPWAIIETPKAGRSLVRGLGASWRQLRIIHACASPNPRFPTCAFLPAGLFGGKAVFFNHFAPSFCNILQQTKHPLLGMFSICFMLILIKEFETEQTVPSRWPYKCEISKLFYLPQTLLVNFFKLIPASESLLIPRRELSNPSLQIFAFVTTPGDWTGGVCHCSTPSHLISQTHLWYPIDTAHLTKMRLT